MTRIGLLCAMREEIQPLLAKMTDIKTSELLGNTYYQCKYHGKELVLVYSRIGKVNSAMTATILLEKFRCNTLLFSGVAGGLSDKLQIGDLVVADLLVQSDFDLTAFGRPLGEVPEAGVFAKTSNHLRTLAVAVAKDNKIKLHVGNVASGDKFIYDIQEKKSIKEEFNAIAIEMEGAPVAYVAETYKVPCLVLRSISDTLDGTAEDFTKFLTEASQKSADFMILLIEQI